MKRSDPRRGVILVTVLWSIALLSALAMAASVTFRGFAGVMAVERDRVQGDALLSAGLETAAGIIDTLGDAPLLDIEAKVNLAGNAARPNSALRSTNVATRTPAMVQPFSDVRQLQLIPGMLPDWVAAIAPLATVFGGETVNPLTAPPGVIAALPGVERDQVAAFLKARRSFPVDVDRLVRLVGPAQRYLAVKPPRVASVELVAELANGYAVSARSVIAVLPQDSQPYRVLVWTPVPSPRLL